MRFRTVSGSEYEIRKGYVRRINPREPKRGDRGWHKLLAAPTIKVGSPAALFMESLAEYGPDDVGNHGGVLTTRTTSRVLEVWDE